MQVRYEGSEFESERIRELENLATMLKQQLADASHEACKQKSAFDKVPIPSKNKPSI